MIFIKTPQEIKIMEEGGKLLSKVMKELGEMVKSGITTDELNRAAEALILKLGAKPNFKGYGGFPAALCVSINEEIVHGVPSQRVLKNGDIVSLDCGLMWKGFHSDMAFTLGVGNIDPEAQRLIRTTKKALKRGIANLKPGNTFGDVGNAIERHIESQGFGVVKDLCGHGIGKDLHEDPKILNYGKRHKGLEIKKGMVVCLEPMATMGDYHIKSSGNGCSFETRDGSLSAHFEHMLAVTERGCQMLTEIPFYAKMY